MPHVHVLSLRGEIDITRKGWIEAQLAAIEALPAGTLAIVDLTAVRYLDTTFLTALSRVGRVVAHHRGNGSVRIVVPRDSLAHKILTFARFDTIFPLFEDLPSARNGGALALA